MSATSALSLSAGPPVGGAPLTQERVSEWRRPSQTGYRRRRIGRSIRLTKQYHLIAEAGCPEHFWPNRHASVSGPVAARIRVDGHEYLNFFGSTWHWQQSPKSSPPPCRQCSRGLHSLGKFHLHWARARPTLKTSSTRPPRFVARSRVFTSRRATSPGWWAWLVWRANLM